MEWVSRRARKARLIFRENEVLVFENHPLRFLEKLSFDLKNLAAFSAPLHLCRATFATKEAAPSIYITSV